MVITADQVSRMSRDVFVAPTVEDVCTCGCGVVIEEHPDDRNYVNGGQVTSECYYGTLSAHLDNNAIETPRHAA